MGGRGDPGDRDLAQRAGIYEKALAQFLTVLCGGERFARLGWWTGGMEIFHRAFGVCWLAVAPSTLTRLPA